ncbi:LysM peptidoglycan-binding domain-containing protein [Salipiger sp. H15]|uniref:LysM peptidoglycan-binding domain-containing protein n=1 Tax=Alloyangia sp. H15 TaxID=3029062 RepID=A0AAU8AFI2_9RHOB
MNNKLWVWIGLGGAAVLGALYVSGVIGPKPAELSLPAVTPVTTTPDAAATAKTEPAKTDTGAAPAVAAQEATAASEAAGTAGESAAATTEATSESSGETAEPEVAGATGTTAETGTKGEIALALPAEGEPATETATALAGATTEAPAAKTAPQADWPAAPSFDLVRAEPGGLITVAGRAEPGSDVVLLLDGREELTSPVGTDGRFAAFFDLPRSDAPQVLRLRMLWQGRQIESEQEVILTPPEPPLVAEEGEGTPEEGTEIAAAGTAAGAAPEQAAPTVLLSDAEGVEVMQSAESVAPGGVAIEAITYDAAGGVELSGRGSGEAFLRVYLDNSEVTTLQVAANGRWQVALPGIAAGTYTLRVDQLDGKGEVTARAESPFRREAPETLAAATADLPSAESVTAVTVQPGNTLWAIARDRYGDGMAYVRVFEANKTQIRDPDLIYPGQVFAFPD